MFSFAQQCQPSQPTTEDATITCVINRQRGDDGSVLVTWAIYQIQVGQESIATTDFIDYTGTVSFQAGERSKVSNKIILVRTVKIQVRLHK